MSEQQAWWHLPVYEITEKQCPSCRAQAIEVSRRGPYLIGGESKHTNGHYNETVTYACGCQLSFSPNYMRTGADKLCPQSERFKELRVEREKKYADVFTHLVKDETMADEVLGICLKAMNSSLGEPYRSNEIKEHIRTRKLK